MLFFISKGPNFLKGEWITPDKSVSSGIAAQMVFLKTYLLHLIAHEAEGRMGY